MHLKKLLLCGVAALALAGSLVSPALAAGSKFWVYNNTGYEIYHVYADRDTSGGQRDLMGSSGVIPPYDQALTLKAKTNRCISNVAVVNEYDQWVWFYDVNICKTGGVRVNNWDFD